ncbi:unnamed protein product [Amaranthus hypochondriacus]
MAFYTCNYALLAISMLFLSGFHVYDAKECTNSLNYNQLSSKTLRYELFTSTNETWKLDMMNKMSNDQFHLTPTEESSWSSLFPRRILREEDESSWNILYQKIKYSDKKNKNFLREISMHNVRLNPNSLHGKAQQTNLEYLLMLDVDSLVWSFRKTAGLSTLGTPYGGWEAPTIELRGHFVGHYLSATAQMWASTHNNSLRNKMTSLVTALMECQDQMGSGYLSAFPSEFFDRFEALKPVWAPYYTIHKIMAGLLEQYKLADNSQALKMVTWMADYFYKRVEDVIKNCSIERHWISLNEETGGMNDVLYQLFSITGDQKHLLLAHLFDKPCFLGILAMQADDISGFHANTHIPIVIGAQMRYELTGDELYKEMSAFFMDVVNSTHNFATGGTSVSEFWQDPKRLGDKLHTENEESCTTYNMLKVSRNLFRWTKEVTYADSYERALTNGVISIQKGNIPGVMIYMLPLGHGVSKGRSYHGWGTPINSFWCCYGTGIESFSKLGDSIYFEEVVDNVFSGDQSLNVKIKVSAKTGSGVSILNLRIPSWTSSTGLKATLNRDPLRVANPGSFLSLSRTWGTADEIALQFPLILRTEFVQDDRAIYSSLQAILYGPFLLAGLSDGDYDIQTGPVNAPSDWISAIPASYNSQLISLVQESGDFKFFLSNQNQMLKMQVSSQAENDSYVHATFRLISKMGIVGKEGFIGKSVMLEPFDHPGMVVSYHRQEAHKELTIEDQRSIDHTRSVYFFIVEGLNGDNRTISLQAKDGCFVYTAIKYSKSDENLKLSCTNGSSLNFTFKEATSFVWNQGFKRYHPMTFLAKGLRRSYILEPLFALKDETYNVYFNITKY